MKINPKIPTHEMVTQTAVSIQPVWINFDTHELKSIAVKKAK